VGCFSICTSPSPLVSSSSPSSSRQDAIARNLPDLYDFDLSPRLGPDAYVAGVLGLTARLPPRPLLANALRFGPFRGAAELTELSGQSRIPWSFEPHAKYALFFLYHSFHSFVPLRGNTEDCALLRTIAPDLRGVVVRVRIFPSARAFSRLRTEAFAFSICCWRSAHLI